jgi:hypothetical protein
MKSFGKKELDVIENATTKDALNASTKCAVDEVEVYHLPLFPLT